MREIRKALEQALRAIHDKVYFQIAPNDSGNPYLVFDLVTIPDDGEGLQIAQVDIDGWYKTNNNDTTALENLMMSVNEGINKKTLSMGEGAAMVLYLDRKMSIPDTDPKIRRRKYTYQARIMGG